jgi:hypothetical protein
MRPRQAGLAVLLGALLTSVSGACGLPGGGDPQVVDDDVVPYHLLETGTVPSGSPGEDRPSPSDPLVFWVDQADRLVPAVADVSCAPGGEPLVHQLLAELTLGPTEERRERGDSTAIPPESDLVLVGLDERTAVVEVGPAPQISAERLPLAVAQIVLTVTSAPGVDVVALVSDGEPVQVPLPGGALTLPPVGPSDYASLVPPQYRDSAPFTRRDPECPTSS